MFVHALDERAISHQVALLVGPMLGAGMDVLVVAGHPTRGGMARMPPGVRVADLGLGDRPTLLGAPGLAFQLRRWRPDVLFAHGNGPGRTAILAQNIARTGTPIVVVEHTHYSSFYVRRRAVRDLLTRLLYPHADRIAGVSPGVVDDLVRRFPGISGRTAVLPAAIPDPEPRMRAMEATPDHPWLSRVDGPLVICAIGNVLPRKGQDTLVRALPRVRRELGDVRLLIVGRVDDERFSRELERLASDLGVRDYVGRTGFQQNPFQFLARADAFAHASRLEGCPTVILEAMSAAIPVVATDCVTGPDYLLQGGRCGLLVPVGDAEAMAGALIRVLSDRDLASTLRTRGLERAREFEAARIASRYLDVLA